MRVCRSGVVWQDSLEWECLVPGKTRVTYGYALIPDHIMSPGKTCIANDVTSRLGNGDDGAPQNMLSNPPCNLTSNQLPRSESPDSSASVSGTQTLNDVPGVSFSQNNSSSYLPNSHPVYNWQATKTTVSCFFIW